MNKYISSLLFLLYILTSNKICVHGQVDSPVSTQDNYSNLNLKIFYKNSPTLLVEGKEGEYVQLQISSDLKNWTTIADLKLEGGGVMFSPSMLTDKTAINAFYRGIYTSSYANNQNGGGSDAGIWQNIINNDTTESYANNPLDPYYLYNRIGPIIEYDHVDINSKEVLRMKLKLFQSLESKISQNIDIQHIQKITTSNQKEGYLLRAISNRAETDPTYYINSFFKINQTLDEELDYLEVVNNINPLGQFANQIAQKILIEISQNNIELLEVYDIGKVKTLDNIYVYIYLKIIGQDKKAKSVYAQLEEKTDGDYKIIKVDLNQYNENINSPNPFINPNESNEIDKQQISIDAESQTGNQLMNYVTTLLRETHSLTVSKAVAINKIIHKNKILYDMLLNAERKGESVIVNAVLMEEKDTQSYEIVNITVTQINSDNTGP